MFRLLEVLLGPCDAQTHCQLTLKVDSLGLLLDLFHRWVRWNEKHPKLFGIKILVQTQAHPGFKHAASRVALTTPLNACSGPGTLLTYLFSAKSLEIIIQKNKLWHVHFCPQEAHIASSYHCIVLTGNKWDREYPDWAGSPARATLGPREIGCHLEASQWTSVTWSTKKMKTDSHQTYFSWPT